MGGGWHMHRGYMWHSTTQHSQALCNIERLPISQSAILFRPHVLLRKQLQLHTASTTTLGCNHQLRVNETLHKA